MKKYDKIAEDLILDLEQGKNENKDNFYLKTPSLTEKSADIICFKPCRRKKMYYKELYQVKSGNYLEVKESKSHVITANFEILKNDDIRFLFLVIYNYDKAVNKNLPIIFKFPIKEFVEKDRKGRESIFGENKIGGYEIYYKRKTFTYITLLHNKLTFDEAKKRNYLYLNDIKS